MVISHLIGGLGNQMFQFAVGRALSLSRDVSFKLDTQDFEGYHLHNGYELGRVFAIDVPIAERCDLKAVLGWRGSSFVRRQLYYREVLKQLRGAHFFVDTQFSTWRQIYDVPDDVYLMGNWQTENYFERFHDAIRSDFTFGLDMGLKNIRFMELIEKQTAVSLHVRRGDVASNPESLAFHGLCPLDYYYKAIEYICARVINPVFFVFSDDIPWVQKNLKLDFSCYFIDHNRGRDSGNDMRLMALCQHNIIANSSFSWWGAWLNSHSGKIVVAPKRWVIVDFDTSDLIPSSWAVL